MANKRSNGIPSHLSFAQEEKQVWNVPPPKDDDEKQMTKRRRKRLPLVVLIFVVAISLCFFVSTFQYGVSSFCGKRPLLPTTRPEKKWWKRLLVIMRPKQKTEEALPPPPSKHYCQVAWNMQESLVALVSRIGLSKIIDSKQQQQQQTSQSEEIQSRKLLKVSPFKRLKSFIIGGGWNKKKKEPVKGTTSSHQDDYSNNKFHYSRADLASAFSEEWIYTPHQKRIAMEVRQRVRSALEQERQEQIAELQKEKNNVDGDGGHHHHHAHVPSIDERLSRIAWGGPDHHSHHHHHVHWWSPPHHHHVASLHPNQQQFDGSHLLAAYLRIMKFPEDLVSSFPFKLCSKEPHCPAEFALLHTLEWRETYRPWCVSPSAIQENQHGFVYLRGFSPSIEKGDSHHHTGGHSVVWFRAAQGHVQDAVAYFRAILQSLELAVADSLHRTKGTIGKFNVVMDAQGVHLNMLPSLGETKKAIVMLQDHFPDRLGMVFLANLSRAEEFLVALIKPLLTKEVRDKITVLPHNPERRLAMLQVAVEHEFIPDFLGGTDDFRFDPETYYDKRHLCSDAEAKEYLEKMLYHA